MKCLLEIRSCKPEEKQKNVAYALTLRKRRSLRSPEITSIISTLFYLHFFL